MIKLIKKHIKTPIILGVFIFSLNVLRAQPKNTNFTINKSIDINIPFDVVYSDQDLADTYAEELSSVLSNELNLKGFSVNFPLELKTILNNDIKSINDYKSNNLENITLFISSQSSSTRNTLKGFMYLNNKLIGSFSAYRTIWNNNRLILLSEYLAKKINEAAN
tara:strand:- start:160 stop:651 length:492 start_codon:yes stop_codon:yes gene_type:complete